MHFALHRHGHPDPIISAQKVGDEYYKFSHKDIEQVCRSQTILAGSKPPQHLLVMISDAMYCRPTDRAICFCMKITVKIYY